MAWCRRSLPECVWWLTCAHIDYSMCAQVCSLNQPRSPIRLQTSTINTLPYSFNFSLTKLTTDSQLLTSGAQPQFTPCPYPSA